MFALAASVQELVLLLQKHLKIVRSKLLCVIWIFSSNVLSLPENVHCVRCRYFDCVTDLSSNPGCRSHRPSYYRTPVSCCDWQQITTWENKPFPVPKQLLLLGHLDVERECSRRVPTSSADRDSATCCESGCP